MTEYEFDAHVVVTAYSQEEAADYILEAMLDSDIAISLHQQGRLNRKVKDDRDNRR